MEILKGYDGDMLFENLELIRTVEAGGGSVIAVPSLYVRRVPPSTGRFLEQRVRQAYEDFALPVRMACWLAVPPMSIAAVAAGRGKAVARAAAATVAGALLSTVVTPGVDHVVTGRGIILSCHDEIALRQVRVDRTTASVDLHHDLVHRSPVSFGDATQDRLLGPLSIDLQQIHVLDGV